MNTIKVDLSDELLEKLANIAYRDGICVAECLQNAAAFYVAMYEHQLNTIDFIQQQTERSRYA